MKNLIVVLALLGAGIVVAVALYRMNRKPPKSDRSDSGIAADSDGGGSSHDSGGDSGGGSGGDGGGE